MLLKVSEVSIRFIQPRQGLIALARIVLNDALVLDGIGIHCKLDGHGHRLTYPTRALANGKNVTAFHPIKPWLSKAVEAAIFEELALRLKDVAHDRYDSPGAG